MSTYIWNQNSNFMLYLITRKCNKHLKINKMFCFRAPPMGWLAWERFRCNTDCENDPHNCIR